jgi:hypothetical protein
MKMIQKNSVFVKNYIHFNLRDIRCTETHIYLFVCMPILINMVFQVSLHFQLNKNIF